LASAAQLVLQHCTKPKTSSVKQTPVTKCEAGMNFEKEDAVKNKTSQNNNEACESRFEQLK
jgi:hypothetical protein